MNFLKKTLVTSILIAGTSPLNAKGNEAQCYWMENTSGKYEWVPAEVGGLYNGEGREKCYELDSCDGGLGISNGGCYKWSVGQNGPRIEWDQNKE